jgi:hypothetical protein
MHARLWCLLIPSGASAVSTSQMYLFTNPVHPMSIGSGIVARKPAWSRACTSSIPVRWLEMSNPHTISPNHTFAEAKGTDDPRSQCGVHDRPLYEERAGRERVGRRFPACRLRCLDER